jgi:hypothetical protein
MVLRRVTPSWLGLSGVLSLVAHSWDVQAEEARQEIAARFSAPTSCSGRAVLAERFEARVPELRMRFTDDAPVEFTITPSGDVVRARLLILLQEGGELSRTIEADNCDAAVEAIAFIAAVALDPGAVDPLKVRGHERLLPEKAVARKPEPEKEDEPPSPVDGGRSFHGGIYGRAELGAGPEFLWGGGVTLESSAERSGFWAPSLRLALGYVRRGGFVEEFGTARFQLASAGVDLCPSQARGKVFRVQLCGTVEGGMLLAEGLDTYAPAKSTRPWFGLGPAIFSEIHLAGPVGLSYRGAAIFPMIRDSFRFDDVTFHQVPAVSLELDAGLSVRF